MICVPGADDRRQCLDPAGGEHAEELFILIDDVVDVAADEQTGTLEHGRDKAGTRSVQPGDDEGAALLLGLLIEDETLVDEVAYCRHASHQTVLLDHEMRGIRIVTRYRAFEVDQAGECQLGKPRSAHRQMRDGAVRCRPLLQHAIQHQAGKPRQFRAQAA